MTDKKPEPEQDGWETVPELAPAHDFDSDPIIIGEYVGARAVDVGRKEGAATIHDFMTETGLISAWGSTVLDRKLIGLQGRFVRVEFQGLGEATKGRDAPRLFDVKYR